MTERQIIEASKKFKEVTQDIFIYSLNEEGKTAEMIEYIEQDNPSKEVFIPRLIKYEAQEYMIKSIKKAFCTSKVLHIKIASDSEIEKIDKNSLSSDLLSITIPSKKDGVSITQN